MFRGSAGFPTPVLPKAVVTRSLYTARRASRRVHPAPTTHATDESRAPRVFLEAAPSLRSVAATVAGRLEGRPP